jgi:hypothetical protein
LVRYNFESCAHPLSSWYPFTSAIISALTGPLSFLWGRKPILKYYLEYYHISRTAYSLKSRGWWL